MSDIRDINLSPGETPDPDARPYRIERVQATRKAGAVAVLKNMPCKCITDFTWSNVADYKKCDRCVYLAQIERGEVTI